MNDLISDEIDSAVPETIRETVTAVSSLVAEGHYEISTKEISEKLGLDKSAALRRINSAISKGYLRNLEDKRGRRARIVIADPMPDDKMILPSPELLRGCMVAADQGEIEYPPPQPECAVKNCESLEGERKIIIKNDRDDVIDGFNQRKLCDDNQKMA
jgi:hypothetical protein